MPATEQTRTVEIQDFMRESDRVTLVEAARREDMGPACRDLTSEAVVSSDRKGEARFNARENGILAGAALLPVIARAYDTELQIDRHLKDGQDIHAAENLATVTGPMRSILAVERVALNFLTHLSGIATLAGQFVDAVRGTGAIIRDTRKTHPGLRAIEKYAVACGGAANHRMGLYDAILIKDNHLAHIENLDLTDAIREVVVFHKDYVPKPRFVEIEVDNLDQLEIVLACPVDIVLLDNMTLGQLRAAVAVRDRINSKVFLEASGGITMESARRIAQTGVDWISVGAITHSAPALDIGLDIETRR